MSFSDMPVCVLMEGLDISNHKIDLFSVIYKINDLSGSPLHLPLLIFHQ